MSAAVPGSTKSRLIELLAVGAVVILLLVSGLVNFFGIARLQNNRLLVRHTNQVLLNLRRMESAVTVAETGQRGFIITAQDEYLEPFDEAIQQIDQLVDELTDLTADNPGQHAEIPTLRQTIQVRIGELQAGITARRQGGFDPAVEAFGSDVGKHTMDRIRDQLAGMRNREMDLLLLREEVALQSYRNGLLTSVLSTICGLALLAGMLYLIHNNRLRAEKSAALIYASRERLRVTLASIGDGVIATDERGRVSYLNPISEVLTGWSNADALGQRLESVFKIIDEDSRQRIDNPALQTLRDEATVVVANRALLISKDGREIPIDDSAAPIRDADGKVIGVVLVFRDVSERRDEDRRLAAAASFTRNIVNSLNEMVIVLDDQLKVRMINRATCNELRVDPRTAVGMSIYKLGNQQLDLPTVRNLIDSVRATNPSLDNPAEHAEMKHEFKLGDYRYFRLSSRRFDPTLAEKGSILLVIWDVTQERTLSEKNRRMDLHMRWFLEQVQDYAIFTMDADCRATSWNQGVEQVLGFTEEEFIGQDIRTLIFTPEAIASGRAAAEFENADRRGQANDDGWMMRNRTERFWASGITTGIFDNDDNLVGYSKVMRDLTDRKREQDELAVLASQLSDADRRKNEFLATLAHELRNPLAPIKNAVQLMGMSKLDVDTEELRLTMERQVEQLVRLIDDLMDVSRISRGKIVLRNEVVDLKTILEAAVESSTVFIEESGQKLSVTCEEDTIFVQADPSRMTQVIANLLNNSAKYSEAGCQIHLRAQIEDGQAVIRVRDNGIGIQEDRLQDIFQMFAQVNDSLERGSAGLGIGLTLVKTLVELHGGSVAAHSDGVGLGSEFTVRLPVSRRPVDSDGSVAQVELASSRSFRILIVEDQRALRMVLTRLLQKMGHEVEAAESGIEALEKLNRYVPDLVFSDISMPGMTGYELVRRLRARQDMANVVFVAMTGYGQATDREKAIESGFDDHMVKPVEVERLQAFFASLS